MSDILIVNHAHSIVCGIHDLGLRMHVALAGTDFHTRYVESNDGLNVLDTITHARPFAIIFNYRSDLMPWVTGLLPQITIPKVAVLHNYELTTIDRAVGQLTASGFNMVLALDPTVESHGAVISAGRPLPAPSHRQHLSDRLTVGSFGFAFPHKGFATVANEIADCAPGGRYRLHMPEAYFNGVQGAPLYGESIITSIRNELPPNVILEYTADHRPTDQVVRMLAGNHVNCLFYVPGQPDAGLSSALDFLIAAGRPILVSEASMFRHALPEVSVWPGTRLCDVLEDLDGATENTCHLYERLTQAYVNGIEKLLERC